MTKTAMILGFSSFKLRLTHFVTITLPSLSPSLSRVNFLVSLTHDKKMFKTIAMLLLLLQLTSFIAFAQEFYTRPPAYAPHTPAPLHPPANAPHHNPKPAPVHAPLHRPTKSSVHTPLRPHPTKPPTHHHPPAHAPIHTLVVPTHPPLHAIVPAKPPTLDHHHHRHHPPSRARVRSPVVPTHPQLHPTPCPRSFNVVQGVVHVKSCEYDTLNSLLGATKLLG